MATSGTRLGTAIRDAFLALNPNAGGMTQAEKDAMEAFAQAIGAEILKEIKDYADIVLTADITVPAAGLISGGPGAPVTGSAMNAPVTLSTKIK